MTSDAHLIALPGGRWQLWRECLLRSAGFPVTRLESLASPELVALADDVLDDAAAMPALEAAFDADLARQAAVIADVVTDTAFREAVIWQNRKLLDTCLGSIERNPERTNSNARRKWATVASYFTRYAAKNDSIGFFGPFCWATIEEEAEGVELQPGDSLIRSRTVSLETWGIAALSEVFGARGDKNTWIHPRMFPYLHLHEGQLHVPYRGVIPVPPPQAKALSMCDGSLSLAAIAQAVADDPDSGVDDRDAVISQLEMAAQMGAIALDNAQPVAPEPEKLLREKLERWEDDVRDQCLADLEALVAARDTLAEAQDEAALVTALDGLDTTFATITGKDATRRAGMMYAGRTLAYFDAHRDLDVAVGADVLDRVGPALSLILESARWFSRHVADHYIAIVNQRFDEVAKDGTVPLAELFHWFEQKYAAGGTLDIRESLVDLQERWGRIIEIQGEDEIALRSEDIAERVRASFATEEAGWPVAYFSPDLMIDAPSVAAIREGDYRVVLGEVHFRNTLRSGATVSQHPDPDRLLAMCDQDYPGVHVASRGRAESHRKLPYLLAPNHYQLDVGVEPLLCRPERVLPVGHLVVHRAPSGELVARTRDGALELTAEAIVGIWLEEACSANHVSFLPRAPRMPRVTIDNLVVARRKWRLAGAEVEPWLEARGAAQVVEARRLQRAQGMPRRVFVSVPGEGKPVYLDFDSPLIIDVLARTLRPALAKSEGAEVSFSEMLPGPEGCWVHDREDRRYTSELRVIARERAEPSR